jgi:CDP-glucose 4,6-dehydratase
VKLSVYRQLQNLPGPVLITGHTGFKGTWLTLLLERLAIQTIGLSLPPEKESLFTRAKRSGIIPEEFVDIRNLAGVSSFFKKYRPSAVIHMAAQPLVLESYKTPIETFETNVMGTVNILDSAIKTDTVRAIISVTTDKVYRNNNSGLLFNESDPLGGKDPYSASKVGAESVVTAWQQLSKIQGGPKIISVRAGNVIGGGDWAKNRLLPDIVRGFNSNEEVLIRNSESTRPWQHVLDPLNGYMLAMEAILSGSDATSFNFGPIGESLSVRKVAEISKSQWPNTTELIFNKSNDLRTIEALNLGLDSSLARQFLGWDQRWSQEDAVIMTIKWWKRYLQDGVSAVEACEIDVNEFLG